MISIRLLAATALAAGALLTAQTASAGPADDAFLDALDAMDYGFSSPEEAIAAGRAICNMADIGLARELLAQQVIDQTGWDGDTASQFVDFSLDFYCPLLWQFG
jgi:Protein of unknown function (DUF732)